MNPNEPQQSVETVTPEITSRQTSTSTSDTTESTSNSKPDFPSKYSSYLYVPALLIILLLFSMYSGYFLFPILVLGLFVSSIAILSIVYKAQIQYIQQFFPSKKIKHQFYILGATVIIPFMAAVIGDVLGSVTFNDELDGIASDIQVGLFAFLPMFLLFFYIIAISNLIYIKTNGQNRGYRLFSKIMYVIGWLIIAGASFIIANIIYTLHDPSTE